MAQIPDPGFLIPSSNKAGVSRIDVLQAEGQFHSSGCFTLQAAEARAKLLRFQLDAGLFLAKWIQAGVSLGSQTIRVELEPKITVTLVGEGDCPLRLEPLLKKLEAPIDLPSQSAEASLMLGVLASQSEGQDRPLTLHLRDPQQGLLVQILGEEARARTLEGVGRDWSLTLTLSNYPEVDELRQMVKQRCGYSPVPIELEGQQLECPWGGEYHIAEAFLSGENTRRIQLPDPHTRPCWCVCQDSHYAGRNSPDPATFLLCYSQESHWDAALAVSDRRGRSLIQWVKAGVILEQDFVDLGTPGMVAVVSAHYLRTDLSHTRLLRDEAYQARLALLREQSQRLMSQVLECPVPMRASAPPKKSLEEWLARRG